MRQFQHGRDDVCRAGAAYLLAWDRELSWDVDDLRSRRGGHRGDAPSGKHPRPWRTPPRW
ncbi:MAG TPA: hypothetical protein PLL54_08160 [Dermatophilaceae bacterium]|nr:hypothetical protein [Dermatophilaceae bacterium]